jgi:hypothetical protein
VGKRVTDAAAPSPGRPDGPPSEAATLERAFSLVNEAMHTVALQRRRLASDEPEDEVFPTRAWADWEFFISALWRLRRRARIAARTRTGSAAVVRAIAAFDEDLPDLKLLRDVAEHIDDYAVDRRTRHHPAVSRKELQVGSWNDSVLTWHLLDSETGIPCSLNADAALASAERLYLAVRAARDQAGPSLGFRGA